MRTHTSTYAKGNAVTARERAGDGLRAGTGEHTDEERWKGGGPTDEGVRRWGQEGSYGRRG
ncbi:hypothetical protein [Streptomyces corynorhini]|uniref:hypothetical protein n=1 Tax=Streptomyces corynorhini TaxID=2282652 RepID=UPI0011C02606|nr:hypothetical protein [Streptomyces corynorhini]